MCTNYEALTKRASPRIAHPLNLENPCRKILKAERKTLWLFFLGIFTSFSAFRIDTLGLLTNSALMLLTSFVLVGRHSDWARSTIEPRSLHDRSQGFREFALGGGIPYFIIYHFLIAVLQNSSISFPTHSAFLVIEWSILCTWYRVSN